MSNLGKSLIIIGATLFLSGSAIAKLTVIGGVQEGETSLIENPRRADKRFSGMLYFPRSEINDGPLYIGSIVEAERPYGVFIHGDVMSKLKKSGKVLDLKKGL